VLAGLAAGCAAPVAAYARFTDGCLQLAARVVDTDGSRILTCTTTAAVTEAMEAQAVGAAAARQLLAGGAAELVNLGASKPAALAGRRILMPMRAPGGLAKLLTASEAEVVEAQFTLPEALPVDDFRPAVAAGLDWLVISSVTTVNVLVANGFGAAELRPPGARVAAGGPATAAALRAVGLSPDLVADPGGGVALVAAGLAELGWQVRPVPVYQTVTQALPAAVVADWQAGRFDAFVVTAGSVARAAVKAAGLPGPQVIAIGEPTAAASRAVGLVVVAVAAAPTTEALAAAVHEALSPRACCSAEHGWRLV